MPASAWSPRCILRPWLSCSPRNTDSFGITLALLAWVFVNCLFLLVLPRPGIAAALSLVLVVLLIVLSRFKFDILQLSLTFLDFLIVDRDTLSFLLSVFPQLRTQLIVAAVIAVPLLWAIWRADPLRVRRGPVLAVLAATTVSMSAMSVAAPEQPWEPFQGVNHVSNLARSGVVAVSRLASTGWIEADPPARRLAWPGAGSACRRPGRRCRRTKNAMPTAKRPHIIMLLDEFEFRHLGRTRRQGAAGLFRLLQVR